MKDKAPDYIKDLPKEKKIKELMSFEEIFKTYYANVVRQIFYVVKDKDRAEELAQDVLYQLYNTEWHKIDNMRAWLYKSAVYASYNFLRSEKRNNAKIDKAIQNYENDESDTLEHDVLRNQEVLEVQKVLKEMNETDRTALLMKSLGYKYKEIAGTLELDISVIGTLIARAKGKFKKLYNQSN